MSKKELLDTRRFLHCILENSDDMVFATDVDGILVSFSKGGEKALGYTMEQMAGRHVKDLVDDPLEFEKLTAISRKEGSSAHLEFPFQHKAGHTIYFDVSLISLTDANGFITYASSASRALFQIAPEEMCGRRFMKACLSLTRTVWSRSNLSKARTVR